MKILASKFPLKESLMWFLLTKLWVKFFRTLRKQPDNQAESFRYESNHVKNSMSPNKHIANYRPGHGRTPITHGRYRNYPMTQ